MLWRSKHMKNVERMLLVKDIKNHVMSQIQFPICYFSGSILLFALNFNWKHVAKYKPQLPFIYFSKGRYVDDSTLRFFFSFHFDLYQHIMKLGTWALQAASFISKALGQSFNRSKLEIYIHSNLRRIKYEPQWFLLHSANISLSLLSTLYIDCHFFNVRECFCVLVLFVAFLSNVMW